MAGCRTPLVSTKAGWPEEAVINGFNGFLTEVDDIDGLVEASRKILLATDKIWKIYSNNAYKTLENSSWQASADMFEAALYRGIKRTKSGELTKH